MMADGSAPSIENSTNGTEITRQVVVSLLSGELVHSTNLVAGTIAGVLRAAMLDVCVHESRSTKLLSASHGLHWYHRVTIICRGGNRNGGGGRTPIVCLLVLTSKLLENICLWCHFWKYKPPWGATGDKSRIFGNPDFCKKSSLKTVWLIFVMLFLLSVGNR